MRSREKIWVVRAGDGKTVAEIVRRAGERVDAVDEGRVFIGRRRVLRADEAVKPGDTVRIGGATRATRETPEITILFEKDDLACCLKPAGLSTVPDHAGGRSLVTLVARALGTKPASLRVTSRLDHDVSGVVIFALTPEAEERLRQARAEGRYQRRYVALAHGSVEESGVWTAPIGRAENPRLRAVGGDKAAATRFARVAQVAVGERTIAMLGVDPVTGRTHQIRVHAMNAGAPLVGDRDYGGPARLTLADGSIVALSRIALHAARVVVPGRREPLEGRAPIPPELVDLWAALGGDREAWDRAVSCDTPPFSFTPLHAPPTPS